MKLPGISLITLIAILLFLPVAFGLDFSMGITDGINGASESQRINVGADSAFASSTLASPEYYSTAASATGSGDFEFNETFDSLDENEHVRLMAKVTDSVNYTHSFAIQEKTEERIWANESFSVNQGKFIDASAEAWNALGLRARAGINITAGSLTDYQSYGDARDASVAAYQNAIVPQGTKFKVFAEAKRGFSLQRSSSTVKSYRAMNAQTTSTVTQNASRIRSVLRPA